MSAGEINLRTALYQIAAALGSRYGNGLKVPGLGEAAWATSASDAGKAAETTPRGWNALAAGIVEVIRMLLEDLETQEYYKEGLDKKSRQLSTLLLHFRGLLTLLRELEEVAP